jgi:hypothetical protein
MTKPHYNVLIATPGGLLHGAYVSSLVETTKWLHEQNLTCKFINRASSFIPGLRESIALDLEKDSWDTNEVGGGQYTYDKIFWIDSDIEWTVEDFKKIYESDKDIISGLYITDTSGKVACASFGDGGLPKVVNEADFFMVDEPVEMFGVGFGFVAMKSGVFENMTRPWFKIQNLKWEKYPVAIDIGEDYSWCMNARNSGFKVYIEPSVRLAHHKGIVYRMRPA